MPDRHRFSPLVRTRFGAAEKSSLLAAGRCRRDPRLHREVRSTATFFGPRARLRPVDPRARCRVGTGAASTLHDYRTPPRRITLLIISLPYLRFLNKSILRG